MMRQMLPMNGYAVGPGKALANANLRRCRMRWYRYQTASKVATRNNRIIVAVAVYCVQNMELFASEMQIMYE